MQVSEALNMMNAAIASCENCEAKLAIARRNGAPNRVISELQDQYAMLGAKRDLAWDAWNAAMQAESAK